MARTQYLNDSCDHGELQHTDAPEVRLPRIKCPDVLARGAPKSGRSYRATCGTTIARSSGMATTSTGTKRSGLVWVRNAAGAWTQVPRAHQSAAARASAHAPAAPSGPRGLLKAPITATHADALMRDPTYGALWQLVLAA
jgi:hypothetical protein